jgi:hypothetical protein
MVLGRFWLELFEKMSRESAQHQPEYEIYAY